MEPLFSGTQGKIWSMDAHIFDGSRFPEWVCWQKPGRRDSRITGGLWIPCPLLSGDILFVSILQHGACFPHLHTLPSAHARSEQQIDTLPEWPSGTQMQCPELGSPPSLQSCSPAQFHCPMNGTAVSLVSKFKHPTMSNFSFSHKPRPPATSVMRSFSFCV